MNFVDRLPMFAGPLVLAGFFLPWIEGRGLLSANDYNGYELMQLSAWLGEAGPSKGEWLLLTAFRVAAAGFVVAGIWLTLTSLWMRDHIAYRIAGTYATFGALGALAFAVYWNGPGVPLPGVMALLAGSASWGAPGLAAWAGRRRKGSMGTPVSASTGS